MAKTNLNDVLNKHKTAEEKELAEIKQWFKDNDWIPNKIIVGEWANDDPRWIAYLEERSIKRSRQDELNANSV